MLIKEGKNAALKMEIYNADGPEVSMCGNGLRAFVHCVHTELGLIDAKGKVETMNSVYEYEINGDDVMIKMNEAYDIKKINIDGMISCQKSFYINTGVPHCVFLVSDVDDIDLENLAAKIAKDKKFINHTNVNFVSILNNKFKVRTYERGVYAETLSCGTGITAVSLALNEWGKGDTFTISTRGGEFLTKVKEGYVELAAPVELIYLGELNE